MSKKSEAIRKYLKEINKLARHCEIVEYDSSNPSGADSVNFKIQLKNDDPYLNGEDAPINVTKTFESKNSELFRKYFDTSPIYNNTHTLFWSFNVLYK